MQDEAKGRKALVHRKPAAIAALKPIGFNVVLKPGD